MTARDTVSQARYVAGMRGTVVVVVVGYCRSAVLLLSVQQ